MTAPETTAKTMPMQGIRVIDISTFIAAPFAATLLGEFGADVIKVELPDVGDPCRTSAMRRMPVTASPG